MGGFCSINLRGGRNRGKAMKKHVRAGSDLAQREVLDDLPDSSIRPRSGKKNDAFLGG